MTFYNCNAKKYSMKGQSHLLFAVQNEFSKKISCKFIHFLLILHCSKKAGKQISLRLAHHETAQACMGTEETCQHRKHRNL